MFVKQSLFGNLLQVKTPDELKDSKEAVRRAVLITKHQCYLVHYEDTLKTLYEMLECDTIDIITRYVRGIPLNIVCDDEGLLKADNFTTAVATDEREMLVGNILICGNDFSEDLADVPIAFFSAIGSCMANTLGLDPKCADIVLRYQVHEESSTENEGEKA